jgi:hypothetical protein
MGGDSCRFARSGKRWRAPPIELKSLLSIDNAEKSGYKGQGPLMGRKVLLYLFIDEDE